MPTIDIPTLVNWLATGFIGLFFGIIGAWVAYRYERKRDDIAWEREKEKLRQQFEHEKESLASQYQQKLEEMNQHVLQERELQIRNTLLRGVENPAATLANMERSQKEFEPQRAERRIKGLIRIDTNELGVIIALATQLISHLHQLQTQMAGRIPPNIVDSVAQVQDYIRHLQNMLMAADQAEPPE